MRLHNVSIHIKFWSDKMLYKKYKKKWIFELKDMTLCDLQSPLRSYLISYKICVTLMLAFIEIFYKNLFTNECARKISAKIQSFLWDVEKFKFLIRSKCKKKSTKLERSIIYCYYCYWYSERKKGKKSQPIIGAGV